MPKHLHALIQIKKPQTRDFAIDMENADDSHDDIIDHSNGTDARPCISISQPASVYMSSRSESPSQNRCLYSNH